MAVRINHNQSAVQTLLNLQRSDRGLASSLERLSSGVRIRRAADDPAGMVIADGLRSQLKANEAAVANVENGVGMLQTADGAAGEIQGLMLRLRELALNAANQAVADTSQLDAMQEEFDEAVRSITRIAEQTRLGSIDLLKGGLSGNAIAADARGSIAAVLHDQVKLPGGIEQGSAITLGAPTMARGQASAVFSGPPASNVSIVGSTMDGTPLTAGAALTLTGPLGSQVVTITGATTFAQFVAAVDGSTASTGLRASFVAGRLTVEANAPGPFAISAAADMSGGAGIGLLDSDTTAATANSYVRTAADGVVEGFAAVFSTSATASTPPAGSAAIANTFQDGVQLDAVASGTLTVRGATATRSYDLTASTTFDELVSRINADAMDLGAFAAYDAVTGRFSVVNRTPEAGRLDISASDMTAGGSTVGFLDDATAGSANGFALDTANLRHERISVDLRTAAGLVPSATLALDGLAQNGTALDIAGGETVTITGLTGSRTITLSPSTTIQQFVDLVNASTRTTGVRAAYDADLGRLEVETVAFGSGTLTIAAQDLTAGGNVGLLDTDTTSATANPLGAAKDAFRMAFTNSGNGTAVVVQANDSIFGLSGPNFTFDDLHDGTTGKQFTVFGNGTSVSLELEEPADGLALSEFIAGQIPNAHYDSAAGTLTLYDDALPAPAALAPALNVTRSTTPQQLAAWLTGNAGFLAAAQLQSVTVTGGDLTLNRIAAATTVGGAASAAALANAAATSLHQVAVSGTVVSVYDGKHPTPGVAASFDYNGKTVAELLAFLNGSDVAAATKATVAQAGANAVFTYVPTAVQQIGGTTIQDVVDFVNANTATTGATASFTVGTLANPSTLSISATSGPINVASMTMTTGGSDAGLMDLDTTTMDSAGDARTARSANALMDFTWTDAAGTTRTIKLVQDPADEDGTVFTNLSGGPEQGPPFSGWEAGAFRVRVQDRTAGAAGAVITAATTALSAERTSPVSVQTGGSADQRTAVELADLRAGNLGRTAYRRDLADTAGAQLLVAKGLDSLQDLVDQRSLATGDAQLALTLIDAAIDEIGTARGAIGAVQSTSLEPAVSSLRVSYENLVSAESRIRDTDFAKESAEFAKQQILFQAATAMLAQANQVPQTVLQLLQ